MVHDLDRDERKYGIASTTGNDYTQNNNRYPPLTQSTEIPNEININESIYLDAANYVRDIVTKSVGEAANIGTKVIKSAVEVTKAGAKVGTGILKSATKTIDKLLPETQE